MSITSIILQPSLFFWGHKFWPDALSRLRWGYGIAAGVLLMMPLVRLRPAIFHVSEC
jgi:hypothetical protein